ncbi:MAG: iron-containing alcohol dehydrogenase [Clostridia bacterium]|nr:iron-containing alcohol dehydrogenase [Clostridia bacterium]
MELLDLLNRELICDCGRTHRCDIDRVEIRAGALSCLPDTLKEYHRILLVADRNTYPLCGDTVLALLGDRVESVCLFKQEEILVPDEESIAAIEAKITGETDMILGIGSGVINDLCKYTSFYHGLRCGIVATAPSMDGYASSGAAMILKGMKVTHTTHAPSLILGDTDILRNAPMEMIRSGYADIIGKYSALCDWKLSELVNGEYLCPTVYDLVMDRTNRIRALARDIAGRKPEAIRELMETLVLIGVTLTLLSTTRPGSGSEHHLSHYFEITGLLTGQPYFLHGTDVGYSTIVTAKLRQELCAVQAPTFATLSDGTRERCYQAIYGSLWEEVRDLQNEAGRYAHPIEETYREKWEEIRAILRECPTADEIAEMLTDCGFDLSLFEKQYGREKIRNGVWFAKDLKDRYSVLWLYDAMFCTEQEAARIVQRKKTLAVMKQSVAMEKQALEALWETMDADAFSKAVDMLLRSSVTVTSACGSSGFAAKKFAHSLCCVECPAKFVPPSEAVHGGMGALKEGNLLILVSKGGKTDELIPLAAIAKAKKARLVVITANAESELARLADAVLLLPGVPESDRYGVMSTASFAATVAIFDALMVGLMEEKDYQLSEFALIHPGGAVGKQIN